MTRPRRLAWEGLLPWVGLPVSGLVLVASVARREVPAPWDRVCDGVFWVGAWGVMVALVIAWWTIRPWRHA